MHVFVTHLDKLTIKAGNHHFIQTPWTYRIIRFVRKYLFRLLLLLLLLVVVVIVVVVVVAAVVILLLCCCCYCGC